MLRISAILTCLCLLAACETANLEDGPEPIGAFKLGFFVPTVKSDVAKGPVSREATEEEWTQALRAAFEPRLKAFDGDHFFHIGATVEGYVLAQPGIPIVLSPKSALIFRVTVIDDETGVVYPEDGPHQLTVLESVSAGSIIGSGLTSTKEEQLADLAENAAAATEDWMRAQPWFYPDGRLPSDIDASVEGEDSDTPQDDEAEQAPAAEDPATGTDAAPDDAPQLVDEGSEQILSEDQELEAKPAEEDVPSADAAEDAPSDPENTPET